MKKRFFFYNGFDTTAFREKTHQLINAELPKDLQSFCYTSFDMSKDNLADLLVESETLPFGFDKKIIQVENFQKIRKIGIFKKIIEISNKNFFFIFHQPNPDYKNADLLKYIKQRSEIQWVSAKKNSIKSYYKKIEDYFQERKITFDPEIIHFIAEHFIYLETFNINDLVKIELLLMNQDSKHLSLDMVQSIINGSQVSDIFKILDSFFMGKKSNCIRNYYHWINQTNEIIYFISVWYNEVHRLYLYMLYLEQGFTETSIMKKLNVYNNYVQDKIKKRAAKFSLAQLKSLREKLIELEDISKSKSMNIDDVDKNKINFYTHFHILNIIYVYAPT